MEQGFSPGVGPEKHLDRIKHLERMAGDSMTRPEESHVPVHETVDTRIGIPQEQPTDFLMFLPTSGH